MLISLQALRALAAWLVVGHHIMQVFFDFKTDSAFGQFFIDKGAVGVDIFFVISGLVIYLSTQGKDMAAGRFLLNRVLRIVPAYWLFSLLAALLIVYAKPMMPGQSFDLQHFILSLLFIPANNPAGYGLYPTLAVGWTLNYEMFFYLLFALGFSVPERFRLWLIAAAIFLVSAVATQQSWVSDFYRNSIVYEFLFGVVLGMVYQRGWIRPGSLLPVLVITCSMLAIYHLNTEMRVLHWGVPSALIVASCISLEGYFRGNRVLKSLGDCSYSVYLVHVLVLSLGWYLTQRYDLNIYWMIGACIPAIVLASWGSYELIEKRFFQQAKVWLDNENPAPNRAAIPD